MGPGAALVIVPCRNEAAVIERKLNNLAALEWPQPGRVLVVDDGSSDGTAALAEAWIEEHGTLLAANVRFEVLRSIARPGKSGAIRSALGTLLPEESWVLLSDADVVAGRDALAALARSFEAWPKLGMLCGSQHFVAELPRDGEPPPAARTGGLYDRWTAIVRRLESRAGLLFSVHGQWLAWRSELGLEPTPGMAADDLDLMLQTRLAGRGIGLAPAAQFFETKTPAGEVRDAQSLRRARAFVQFLGHPRMAELARSGSILARVQLAAYRWLPRLAPYWVPAVLLLALLGLALLVPPPFGLLAALAVVAVCLAPPVRRLFRLLGVIRAATRGSSAAQLSDRWETPRA